ncbi:MAG: phenylpyruvate tautomerase MIF-related protein [Sedimentisphaerales bacterium]
MPLIQLDTSCDLSNPEKRKTIAKEISSLAAECIGKPEHYVMTCVRDNVVMTMSGTDAPAASVSVKSIGGLSREVNKKLSVEICQMLQKELGITGDRVYLTFEELSPTHWGWKADTFG